MYSKVSLNTSCLVSWSRISSVSIFCRSLESFSANHGPKRVTQ